MIPINTVLLEIGTDFIEVKRMCTEEQLSSVDSALEKLTKEQLRLRVAVAERNLQRATQKAPSRQATGVPVSNTPVNEVVPDVWLRGWVYSSQYS